MFSLYSRLRDECSLSVVVYFVVRCVVLSYYAALRTNLNAFGGKLHEHF